MIFNFEKRKVLEEYIQKKVTITRIAQVMKVSRTTIYNELALGVSEEDLAAKNYRAYNAELAQENLFIKLMDKVK